MHINKYSIRTVKIIPTTQVSIQNIFVKNNVINIGETKLVKTKEAGGQNRHIN
jgi:hypothetical protein